MLFPVGHQGVVRSPAIADQVTAVGTLLNVTDCDDEDRRWSSDESAMLHPNFINPPNLARELVDTSPDITEVLWRNCWSDPWIGESAPCVDVRWPEPGSLAELC